MDRRSATTSIAAAAVAALVAAGGRPADGQGARRSARSSFVETDDGASLFHVDWGTGKPVVFTHAWGLNADIWEYQLVELADQGLRCVAYDRRGHGRSSDPGRGYDYDRLADDLAAVINQLDLTDVTLVGHSMGNGEAVRYLQRHGSARDRAAGDAEHDPASVDQRLQPADRRPEAGPPGLLRQGRHRLHRRPSRRFTGHDRVDRRAVHARLAEGHHRLHARHRGRRFPRGHARRHRADIDRPWRQGSWSIRWTRPRGRSPSSYRVPRSRCTTSAPHGLVITHRDRLARDILAFARG